MSWKTERLVVVDVEGNGQQPPEIVEIGIVSVVGGSICGKFESLVRPKLPISSFAKRVHGISDEAVSSAPGIDELSGEVLKLLSGSTLVAHAAHVESSILKRQIPDWQPGIVIDTVKLAKKAWPSLPSYRLDALRGDKIPSNDSHRALADAESAFDLFVASIAVINPEISVDQLAAIAGSPAEPSQPSKQTAFPV